MTSTMAHLSTLCMTRSLTTLGFVLSTACGVTGNVGEQPSDEGSTTAESSSETQGVSAGDSTSNTTAGDAGEDAAGDGGGDTEGNDTTATTGVSGGNDTGGSDTGDMGGDGTRGGPVPDLPETPMGEPSDDCACLVEGDVCWDGIRCANPEIECSAVQACPDSYACIEGTCVCNDLTSCAVTCLEDEECGTYGACDPNYASCRVRQSCLFSDDCDSGEVCEPWRIPDGDPLRWEIDLGRDLDCYPAGDRAVGEACSDPLQCASGICEDVCLEPCRRNDDCAQGLVCAGASGGLGCMIPGESDCGSSCTGPGQSCPSPYPGCVTNCRAQSDCGADERCSVSSYSPDSGFCDDGMPPCPGADEFGFWGSLTDSSEQLCFTNRGCWSHQDCPDGFACRIPTDDLANSPVYYAGFCARME